MYDLLPGSTGFNLHFHYGRGDAKPDLTLSG
jgi:hypothetical protein